MVRYILGRFAATLPTLLGMSFIAFAIVALAPGDPVQMELRAMGVVPKPEDIAAIKAEYGLDKPFFVRYFHWLWRALHLDFGSSLATGRSVVNEISLYMPATLMLAFSSLLGAVLISVIFGIVAVMADRFTAAIVRAVTILLVSIPSFWLALMLIHIFIMKLGWSSLVGEGHLSDLILPALTLSLGAGASIGRLVYERVRAEASEDYVRLAIAKGLSPARILVGHVGPRIIGPLATVWATMFGWMLGRCSDCREHFWLARARAAYIASHWPARFPGHSRLSGSYGSGVCRHLPHRRCDRGRRRSAIAPEAAP